MRSSLRKTDPFKGMVEFEKQFVFNSFLYVMKETDNRETADRTLYDAYKLKASNYQEIEAEYHKKFPSQNKIS